jgi:type I restriction enzyme M protein
VHRELTDADIAKIAGTYHAWRGDNERSEVAAKADVSAANVKSPSDGRSHKDAGEYKDVPGFCKRAQLLDIRKHGHVLTPGRYVGAEAAEDDGEPFEGKMRRLTATLREQQDEAAKLDAAIAANLRKLGYGG